MKFIHGLAITCLLLANLSLAEEGIKVIGLSVWSGYPESVKGFKSALSEHGYIEGKNVEYILRNANSDPIKQKIIAKEMLLKNPDLVYSLTTPGTVIIKNTLLEKTPIVFSIVTYPADAGLIESFDYSGNNLVGTSNFVPLQHYVDLLIAALPKAKTIAIFHRKGEPNSKIQSSNLIRLFKRKGIKVIDIEPISIEETTLLAEEIVTEVDAFVTTTDTLMQNGGELALIKLAKKNNIPILSSNKKGIEQGSTFGPVADFYTLGKMSGNLAVKILNGSAQPHTLASKYQDPPTFLVNKQRFDALKLKFKTPPVGLVYVK